MAGLFYCPMVAMRPTDVIQIFADREEVPVDVNEVVDVLRGSGIKHDIFFYEVRIEDESLRGALLHWEWPNTDPIRECADIYYASDLGSDWKRLVCCKELLHILDKETYRVKTPAEVKRLVERIVLPTEFQDPIKDGIGVITDRFAIYQAVAVLFPWATRELLLAPYKSQKLTVDDIAKMVDLPPRYVKLVMSDYWPDSYKTIVDMN